MMNIRKFKRVVIDFLKYNFMLLIKKDVVLTLNGGFGDVVLDTQFFYAIKEKYPNKKIFVYFRDNIDESNRQNFSWGKTRHYQDSNGIMVNPIVEWLEKVKAIGLIDDYIGTNIDTKTYGIRMYPEYFKHFFGGYFTPKKFKEKILDPIFSNYKVENRKVLNQLEEYKKDGKKVVSLHLRRNSDNILDLARSCDNKNTVFVLLGSTEHQVIPSIALTNTVSLIDSYSKNLGLLDVLYISFRSDLFIGGRGGFELCHWLNCMPCANIFDSMGFQEVTQGWWDSKLWEVNVIDRLFSDQEDMEQVKNYLKKQDICQ